MAHSAYLDLVIRPSELKATVDWASKLVETLFPDVDYIAATGVSGIFCTGAVCARTGKAPFLIRKPHDDTHSHESVEFPDLPLVFTNKTAVIIDDFISAGTTMRKIISILESKEIKAVGIILYDEYDRERHKDWNIPILTREGWRLNE
jgi:adenine/guanine phosphoribosyltransferase-like PRPP-binding protein